MRRHARRKHAAAASVPGARSASTQADVSLLDVIDHVLNQGVVLSGEMTLGVADVDLIYVRLAGARLFRRSCAVASGAALEPFRRRRAPDAARSRCHCASTRSCGRPLGRRSVIHANGARVRLGQRRREPRPSWPTAQAACRPRCGRSADTTRSCGASRRVAPAVLPVRFGTLVDSDRSLVALLDTWSDDLQKALALVDRPLPDDAPVVCPRGRRLGT